MRWNKYEVTLTSPVWTQIRQLSPSNNIIIIIIINLCWQHSDAIMQHNNDRLTAFDPGQPG